MDGFVNDPDDGFFGFIFARGASGEAGAWWHVCQPRRRKNVVFVRYVLVLVKANNDLPEEERGTVTNIFILLPSFMGLMAGLFQFVVLVPSMALQDSELSQRNDVSRTK